MEEASSSGESSTGNSSSDREEDISGASFMFYFAKNYAKLQMQINPLKMEIDALKHDQAKFKVKCSNCESSVYARLDAMEQNIAQMGALVIELANNVESIQKEMSRLNIAANHQDCVETSPKNISARLIP